mgnify:CR=1 FL=1
MKYIVGASIGGLFGLGMPMIINVQDASEEVLRIENSQPVQEVQPIFPSQGFHHLPDNVCRYIPLESDDPKEQAKECLDVDIFAMPAI